MLKGFKAFIMRGNVIDLAVGIVIGAAFAGVVNQFTDSFLEPLIRVFSGGEGITAGAVEIRGQSFDWAPFLNSLITFLLTAAALYFIVVLPMNRLAERRDRGDRPLEPAETSDEVRLLTEIRDALVAPQAPQPPRSPDAEVTRR